jgi:hypothetical protein
MDKGMLRPHSPPDRSARFDDDPADDIAYPATVLSYWFIWPVWLRSGPG